MSHMWSGRFDMAPDEDVFSFQASFGFDRRLFEDDVTGSLAWADALAEAQVLAVAEAVAGLTTGGWERPSISLG